MIRATLFACVIVAGAAGCRDRARNIDESSYTKPVETEATTDRVDRTAEDRTVRESSNPVPTSPVPATTSDDELQPDVQGRAFESSSLDAESSAGEMPASAEQESAPGQGAGANASEPNQPTTIIITPGTSQDPRAGANTGTGTTGTAGSVVAPNTVDPRTGTLTPQAPSEGAIDRNTNAPVVEPSDTSNTTGTPSTSEPPSEPPSGTSEAASGHGTPTDTGINTENAGTGGNVEPTQ